MLPISDRHNFVELICSDRFVNFADRVSSMQPSFRPQIWSEMNSKTILKKKHKKYDSFENWWIVVTCHSYLIIEIVFVIVYFPIQSTLNLARDLAIFENR